MTRSNYASNVTEDALGGLSEEGNWAWDAP